jgi:hypothetical protein
MSEHEPIVPEHFVVENPNYAPGHWDYERRCMDLDLALTATRERIQEWDKEADPHGWWHERPQLIALYNAAVAARLRDIRGDHGVEFTTEELGDIAQKLGELVARRTEVFQLRQAIWDAFAIMGGDTDGQTCHVGVSFPGLGWAGFLREEAKGWREEYDDAVREAHGD